jgi:putative phosphoesterase
MLGSMARQTVVAPEGQRFLLGVLSDSHGSPHRSTAAILEARRPDAIVHAGDVSSLGVVRRLERIAPTYAVRGNIDSASLGLPEVMTVEIVLGGRLALTILLVHVGIARLRLVREVRELALEEDARLVICGHSHLPFLGRDGDLVVFNPGSHGPRRFDYPVTMGFVEITPTEVRPFHVDCETGGRWVPTG